MVEGVVEAVDGGMAQIENIGGMWDRLCGSAIGGLVIIFVMGASLIVIGLTGGSFGSRHGETVQNVYSCNHDRIEVYLLSPFGVLLRIFCA